MARTRRAIVRAHRFDRHGALVFVDLDGMKRVVLLSEFEDDKGAEVFARKLLAGLDEACRVRGRTIQVGASIGIPDFAGPERHADEVLRDADQAMYAAKRAGGGAIFRASAGGAVPVS